MGKKTSRAEVLAKLASGVALSDEEVIEANAEVTEEATEVETSAAAEETVVAEPEETPEQEPDQEPVAASAVDHTAQLLDLTKANAKLEVKVEQLESDLANEKAASESARTVIRTATERLGLSLGATVVGLDTLSLSALCTQFNTLNTQFEARFKVGPVAQVQERDVQSPGNSDAAVRRIKASRINKGDK